MAGLCVGLGLDIDSDGRVEVDGAHQATWPYPCAIASRNGLQVDPVTNELWVKGPQIVGHGELQGAPISYVPPNDSDHSLGHYVVNHTVGDCSKEFITYHVMGGYAGFRLASGNFWIVQRYITIKVNGVTTGFTGLEPVCGAENNSGGVTSQSGPVEASEGVFVANPGDVIQVIADYTLSITGFNANGANNFVFRPPRVSLVAIPTE